MTVLFQNCPLQPQLVLKAVVMPKSAAGNEWKKH
jgi:hypothetical protein